MTDNSTLTVRIVQKRLESDDVVSLRLRSLDGSALPGFTAGAHIELTLGSKMVRQYSLCGQCASPDEYEIAVLREPKSRGGSMAIHDDIQVGQIIEISLPRNHFPLESDKGRILLMAGGIGITPILAMAEELSGAGLPYEMHYCARSPQKMAYRERAVSSGAVIHFDDGPQSQRLDAVTLFTAPSDGDHLYVCGPAGFIEFVLKSAQEAGWHEKQLHREFFAAPDSDTDYGENAPFTVVIGSSGLHFQVPADQSIATVLEENGIFVPTSCSEGICGTCVVNVIEGTPDHRDFLFSDAEKQANDRLTTCCSRSKTPILVLDL